MRKAFEFGLLIIAGAALLLLPAPGAATADCQTECSDKAPGSQTPPDVPSTRPTSPEPTSPASVAPTPSLPAPEQQPAVKSRSYWNHNGSVVYLIADGNSRSFYYHKPRAGMVAEGVTPGTLLFSGTVHGGTYQGTAYLFSARCGKRTYPVQGQIEEDGDRVTMNGPATVVNRSCDVVQVINDVLVFQYIPNE